MRQAIQEIVQRELDTFVLLLRFNDPICVQKQGQVGAKLQNPSPLSGLVCLDDRFQ